jgi:hypothetical protein
MEQMEQPILVVVVVGHIQQEPVALAVLALSSCPTIWR